MHVMNTCVRQVGATVLFTLPRLSYQCGVGSACAVGRQFSASPLQLQVLCMPRKMRISQCTAPATKHILRFVAAWRGSNTIAKTQLHKSKLYCTCHEHGHGPLSSTAPATKNDIYLGNTMRQYCSCHTKRLSTRCRTHLNFTKCHACHTKWHCTSFVVFQNIIKHPKMRGFGNTSITQESKKYSLNAAAKQYQ